MRHGAWQPTANKVLGNFFTVRATGPYLKFVILIKWLWLVKFEVHICVSGGVSVSKSRISIILAEKKLLRAKMNVKHCGTGMHIFFKIIIMRCETWYLTANGKQSPWEFFHCPSTYPEFEISNMTIMNMFCKVLGPYICIWGRISFKIKDISHIGREEDSTGFLKLELRISIFFYPQEFKSPSHHQNAFKICHFHYKWLPNTWFS